MFAKDSLQLRTARSLLIQRKVCDVFTCPVQNAGVDEATNEERRA